MPTKTIHVSPLVAKEHPNETIPVWANFPNSFRAEPTNVAVTVTIPGKLGETDAQRQARAKQALQTAIDDFLTEWQAGNVTFR